MILTLVYSTVDNKAIIKSVRLPTHLPTQKKSQWLQCFYWVS